MSKAYELYTVSELNNRKDSIKSLFLHHNQIIFYIYIIYIQNLS